MDYRDAVHRFCPATEEERTVQRIFEDFIQQNGDHSLCRESELAHFTSSAMIFTQEFSKVLMVYHRIYQSWAWSGGHCDGETQPLQTALREAREETGIQILSPLSPLPVSLDILPVPPHRKNGSYVPAHLHLSLCYAFSAPEGQPLRAKPDENSGVQWIPIPQLSESVSEAHMLPLYERIIRRVCMQYTKTEC